MATYFGHQIAERRFPLKCPDPECHKDVADEDIRQILSLKKFAEYEGCLLEHTISQQADMSWCPTPDCNYAFIFEQGSTEFKCQKCQKFYCLECMVPFHVGKTCRQFKAARDDKGDDKFLRFVKGSKFKQCPQCKVWVEKSHGCDHMRCTCGRHFCYRCGGIYKQCECY